MKPPKGFGPSVQIMYLHHIREGMQRGSAARALDLDVTEIRRFIEGDVSFRQKLEDAEQDAFENVQEALYQGAVSGNVSAAKIWLELKGAGPVPAERRQPGADPPPGPGNFDDLDNVTVLDPRQRQQRKQ
jgi:hypothetical protein